MNPVKLTISLEPNLAEPQMAGALFPESDRTGSYLKKYLQENLRKMCQWSSDSESESSSLELLVFLICKIVLKQRILKLFQFELRIGYMYTKVEWGDEAWWSCHCLAVVVTGGAALGQSKLSRFQSFGSIIYFDRGC
jgi:hypothetical protein